MENISGKSNRAGREAQGLNGVEKVRVYRLFYATEMRSNLTSDFPNCL